MAGDIFALAVDHNFHGLVIWTLLSTAWLKNFVFQKSHPCALHDHLKIQQKDSCEWFYLRLAQVYRTVYIPTLLISSVKAICCLCPLSGELWNESSSRKHAYQ